MIQAGLFSEAEINDLDAPEFDRTEYIIDANKLPDIEEAIRASGKIAFDVETSGLTHPFSLVGLGLAWEEEKSIYIPTGHITQVEQIPLATVTGFLNHLFKDVLVLPFNATFELRVMEQFGVQLPNFDDVRYYAIAHDERNSRKSLKDIAKEHFGMEWGTIREVCSRRVKERNVNGRMVSRIVFDVPGTSIEKLGRYCRTDCEATLKAYNKFKNTTLYAIPILALEKSVTPVVVAMENRGIRIDIPAIEKKLLETRNKLVTLEEEIYAQAGKIINLNSPQQISALMFDEIGLRAVNGRSVDVNTLQELKNEHPIPNLMLEYRELDKIRGTYLEPLLEKNIDGRIFTHLNQLGTESGRFSSSRPNMQNIPIDPEIRKLFIATEGMLLLDYDYSQIEGRVFAHASQDKVLLEYYRNGGDIHTATSEKLEIPRKLAKTINFAIIYGAAPRKLSEIMQKEGFIYDEQEARSMIRSFWKLYKGGNDWSLRLKKNLHKDSSIFTVFGRRRIFPEINLVDNYAAFSMEREAVNFVIQGCMKEDNYVLTRSGYQQLKAFEVGEVWTGEKWASAKKLARGEDKVVKVKLNNGYEFICDTRHKILGYKNGAYPEWLTVGEFEGSELANSKYPETIGVSPEDSEFWYWIGRYYGDGNIYLSQEFKKKKGYITWTFGKDEENDVKRCVSYWEARGLSPKVRTNRKPNTFTYSVYIYSKSFVESLFNKYSILSNQVSWTKTLSPFIFQLDAVRRNSVFQGYHDADGTTPNGRGYQWQFTSVNYELLKNVWLLGRTIGLDMWINGPYQNKVSRNFWRLCYVSGHKADKRLRVELVTITDEIAPMFTLIVDDEKHSFDSEGLISKNTAADIMKFALVGTQKVLKALNFPAYALLQVHDELLFEGYEDNHEQADRVIRHQMEIAAKLDVPLIVEGKKGQNWAECH